MQIAPLHSNVLVKLIKPPEVKSSIIVVEGSSLHGRYGYAQVIATGPGSISDDGVVRKMTVAPGDRVLILAEHGVPVAIPGETINDLLMINEGCIAARITETP